MPQWTTQIYEAYVHPNMAPSQGTIGQNLPPVDRTFRSVNKTLVGLREAIEGQIITKKKEQDDKKDKWGKLPDHHKDMILNVGSTEGTTKAVVPTKDPLEVMNRLSLINA